MQSTGGSLNCALCYALGRPQPSVPPADRTGKADPSCRHRLIHTHTYYCPSHSHDFGNDPKVDCVAKIINMSSFHDDAIGAFNHPNIVRHVETRALAPEVQRYFAAQHGRPRDTVYSVVVSEFCQWGSLNQQWRDTATRKRGKESTEWLVVQLLLALHQCHATHNIMHRDVTSTNIFVADLRGGVGVASDQTDFFDVKLGDFGLSKPQSLVSVGQPAYHSTCGTSWYLCPELMRAYPDPSGPPGDPTVYSSSADIFALGVALYEYLCYATPFGVARAEDRVLMGSALQLLQDRSPTPEIAAVVAAMLKFHPDERPTALGAFRAFPFLRAALQWYAHSREKENPDAPWVPTLKAQVAILAAPALQPSDRIGVFQKHSLAGARGRLLEVFVTPVGVWSHRRHFPQSCQLIQAAHITSVTFDDNDEDTPAKDSAPLMDDEDSDDEGVTPPRY